MIGWSVRECFIEYNLQYNIIWDDRLYFDPSKRFSVWTCLSINISQFFASKNRSTSYKLDQIGIHMTTRVRHHEHHRTADSVDLGYKLLLQIWAVTPNSCISWVQYLLPQRISTQVQWSSSKGAVAQEYLEYQSNRRPRRNLHEPTRRNSSTSHRDSSKEPIP